MGCVSMFRTAMVILAGVASAGCGKTQVVLPPDGSSLTYLRVISPVQPYPQATLVKLAVDNTEFDRRTGQVIEHPETVRVLSAAERATFEKTLHRERVIGIRPPEPDSPACFIPHHFFRYYSGTGQQIGEIKLCFCCGGYRATPAFPYGSGRGGQGDEFKVNLTEAKAFVQSLGLRTDMMCD
jgi:hypothetical protein